MTMMVWPGRPRARRGVPQLQHACGIGRGACVEWLGTSASPRSLASSLWVRIALFMFAGLVRSGWACRPLCARLCLGCGVELRYACGTGAEWLGLSAPLRVFAVSLPGRLVCCCVAGVEWLGSSASLPSLASSLWSRIAIRVPAGPVRSGWACRPLRAHLCLPNGDGLHYARVSGSLRSLVSSLWGRIMLCLRSRRGVAGHVGLSAFACAPVAGSDCAACLFVCCLYVCCRRWCGRPPCVYLFLA